MLSALTNNPNSNWNDRHSAFFFKLNIISTCFGAIWTRIQLLILIPNVKFLNNLFIKFGLNLRKRMHINSIFFLNNLQIFIKYSFNRTSEVHLNYTSLCNSLLGPFILSEKRIWWVAYMILLVMLQEKLEIQYCPQSIGLNFRVNYNSLLGEAFICFYLKSNWLK